MTVSDNESKLNEMERDNLQNSIAAVERRTAGSAPGERSFFEPLLLNMRGRLATLEKKIKEAQVEKESHARDVVAVAQLAQKETALSTSEKESFSGFLKEAYFTTKDFDRLEKFYSHTWDRLSEEGKDEMSKRVWEGIRHDEYKFTDLPRVVQEKEAERAYQVLKKREAGIGAVSRISEVDRDDLIRAYEGGNRDKTCDVLDRKSFRDNMFVGATSKETKDIAATRGKDAEGTVVAANTGTAPPKQPDQVPAKPTSKSDLDASAFNLDGLKIADAPAAISSRDIPAAATPKGAKSFRGG